MLTIGAKVQVWGSNHGCEGKFATVKRICAAKGEKPESASIALDEGGERFVATKYLRPV